MNKSDLPCFPSNLYSIGFEMSHLLQGFFARSMIFLLYLPPLLEILCCSLRTLYMASACSYVNQIHPSIVPSAMWIVLSVTWNYRRHSSLGNAFEITNRRKRESIFVSMAIHAELLREVIKGTVNKLINILVKFVSIFHNNVRPALPWIQITLEVWWRHQTSGFRWCSSWCIAYAVFWQTR